MKRLMMTAVLAATLSAPAFAAGSCLIASQIDGFKNATRTSVTLTAGSKNYDVEFAGSCIGLDSALQVAARSAMGCFEAGDKLTFEDSTGFPQSCIAAKVTYVDKDAPAETPASD